MQNKTRSSLRVLSNGTTIKTTKSNNEKKSEWTEEGWNARKWNVKGEIIDYHNGHGFYYDVKHEDGTVAGYNPEEIEIISFTKEDILTLTTIRNEVQSFLSNENLEITFYNPFNMQNRKSRKAPDRYLVCFARSIEIRNVAFDKAVEEGYTCKKGKTYENRYEQEINISWTFVIDLIS